MPIRLALAACALLVAACGGESSDAPMVAAEPVALFPDDPGRERIGSLRYTGGVVLSSADERFGGWSAIELSEDGSRLLAISDSATWMTAELRFGAEGQLTGLSDVTLVPMLDLEGRKLSGEAADAEGLASLGDGQYAVSFERQHRIDLYELGQGWAAVETATAAPLPAPPGANRLRNNAGIEALAVSGDGLFAGVEYPIMEGQPYQLWRYDLSDIEAEPGVIDLNLTAGHGLTAMAGDGEGGLFVVERYYARNVGNRIRVGHLAAEALANATAPVSPQLLAEITPDMTVDNIEAVAVVEAGNETRLLLMSDDNFNPSQRTLLLSFVLERETP
ncbi:esterase-like activity of phytase family protein [Maricaulaceae bacterium EIL42A08]|nr:esterase-like activity of phytase family protein [Maricaulaceae bacterium EIL42A08]